MSIEEAVNLVFDAVTDVKNTDVFCPFVDINVEKCYNISY